jgi:phage shock protein PspC (stress-responsive transcriptional regulator)
MKKTLTVNLNGRVFHVDEDAYQLLDRYLRNLRIYFRKEEGREEILADFEARIEELLSDRRRTSDGVISMGEVEAVIARMGRPGDFGEKETEAPEDRSAEGGEAPKVAGRKKFYRNPEDKMFAGLCSGVAAYFGWDVIFVRIVAAVLIPVSSLWIVPVYLILWLVVPESLTAEQKLEMQGKPITVENIGKAVADGLGDVKRAVSRGGCLASFVDFIAAFFKVCLVGLGVIVGIPLMFVLVAVIIVLLGIVFGVSTGILGGLIPWTRDTLLFVGHPALATIGFCLIAGIPLVALIYSVIARLFQLKPVHPGVKWSGVVLWVLAAVALFCSEIEWDRVPWRGQVGWYYHNHDNYSVLHGNGVPADRRETLPPVRYVHLEKHLAGDLQLEQVAGDSARLLIGGDSNLIDKVEVEVKSDGRLLLSTADGYRLRPTGPLLIRLQTPEPRGIKVLAFGNIDVSGVLRVPDFSIHVEGAGKIQADSLYVDALRVRNEGMGSVRLGGAARNATLRLKGAGYIQALELVADSIDAEVNGVGSVRCNPVEYLHGYVEGIGVISYLAEPRSKNTNINGLGVIKRE